VPQVAHMPGEFPWANISFVMESASNQP